MKQQKTIASRIAKNIQHALEVIPRMLNEEKENIIHMTNARTRGRKLGSRTTRKNSRKAGKRVARRVGRPSSKLKVVGARAKRRTTKPAAKKQVAKRKVKHARRQARRENSTPVMQAA
jgi:predicted transcriptional regulator YheO